MKQFIIPFILTCLIAGCAGTGNTSLCTGAAAETERLFLQQVGDSRASIRWRGGSDTVCIGTAPQRLTTRIVAVEDTGHRMATVTGLRPDTRYYYSVGGAATAQPNHHFTTTPPRGELPADGTIRLWLLGDSGSANEVERDGSLSYPGMAEAVRDSFLLYNERESAGDDIDAVVLLGDNAYPAGTDEEWQGAFFEIYPDILSRVQTLPTIGNHEMGVAIFDICLFAKLPNCADGPVPMPLGGASNSSDPLSYDGDGDGPDAEGFPYFNIFALPTQAEMGGAPSGTEQYYSVDIGTVHVIALDSQLSNADAGQRAAMRDWLIDDLMTSNQPWNIVVFHHPAYSKGEHHDSDVEQREIDMRETFAPVFEEYGVDVIYNGHAHSYERSWYLRGHYGLSETFDAARHAALDADGNPAFGHADAPYTQVSPGTGADDRAVYTVAGNSGKYDKFNPCQGDQRYGCTLPDWLQHPAHRTFEKLAEDYEPNGIARLGSVVIDVNENSLTSRFVDVNGDVLDHFVITR